MYGNFTAESAKMFPRDLVLPPLACTMSHIVHAFCRIEGVCCAGHSKSVKFYNFGHLGGGKGECVVLQRQGNNPYGTNCVDVRLVQRRLLLGDLKVAVATCFSPLIVNHIDL